MRSGDTGESGKGLKELNALGVLLKLHIGFLGGRAPALVEALPLHLAKVVYSMDAVHLNAKDRLDSLLNFGLVGFLIHDKGVNLVGKMVVALLGENGL